MTWRGVHKPSPCILSDMIALKQRYEELVTSAKPLERMRTEDAIDYFSRKRGDLFECLDARVLKDVLGKLF